MVIHFEKASDYGDNRLSMEVNTIEDILKLGEEYNNPIIVYPHGSWIDKDGKVPLLMVYDDYLE